jgi:hypothetical protein
MTARTYAENRPYLLPDTLGELVGPVTGVVQLPLRLDWSETVLRQVWRQLFLPVHVRHSWEERFPDLRLAA